MAAMPWDGGRSGISAYIRGTLTSLSRRADLEVVAHESDIPALEEAAPRANFHAVPDAYARPAVSMAWHAFALPRLLDRIDADWVFLPAANRRALASYDRTTVATVHDLAPFHVPRKYGFARDLYVRHLLPRIARRAPALVAISEATRQDMVKFWGIPADRITVSPNGFDASRFREDDSPVTSRQVVGNLLDLKRPYVLYTARIEHPGKNHVGLLEAWERLPEALRNHWDLVFAGADWSGAEHVHAAIDRLTVRTGCRVKRLGFVADRMLPHLYRAADALVFPSLYEGFGLPVLEAMACGTPVACANVASLPEVAGKAALLFDPQNPDAIAASLVRLATEPGLAPALKRAGLERVAQFTWDRHVDGIVSASRRHEKVA